jgi:hypothetical protein
VPTLPSAGSDWMRVDSSRRKPGACAATDAPSALSESPRRRMAAPQGPTVRSQGCKVTGLQGTQRLPRLQDGRLRSSEPRAQRAPGQRSTVNGQRSTHPANEAEHAHDAQHAQHGHEGQVLGVGEVKDDGRHGDQHHEEVCEGAGPWRGVYGCNDDKDEAASLLVSC